MRLLEEGDDDFRGVYREAFASTHDLARQLALLEDAWTNPTLIPRYDTPDALNETRTLLAGRNLQGVVDCTKNGVLSNLPGRGYVPPPAIN
jgi:hypothetical protein